MIPRVVLSAGALCAIVAQAFVAPLSAQGSSAAAGKASAKGSNGPSASRPLPVAVYAGQTVPVLPITLIAADAALKQDSLYTPYAQRDTALTLSDSAIGTALAERGPEVQWVLPAALRKLARRSPGMIKNPDELGQAVLRSPRIKEVPEPLRAELRKLVAVSGGRAVLVPASLGFSPPAAGESAGMRADLTLVLVDARAGKVLWRSVVSGNGTTPSAALDAALAVALPLESP